MSTFYNNLFKVQESSSSAVFLKRTVPGLLVLLTALAGPLMRSISILATLPHREIIVQLSDNSGHIANPFSPLFYPYRLESLPPFI